MIDFEKIGKYAVTGKLGQGSFGVVYRGHDNFLKRDVAIKICSVEDENLRKRFRREGEIAGRLKHRNIVTVYEGGFERQIPYLVQELLTGEDLSRLVKRRAEIAHATKLEYLLQVAHGLAYAHKHGVIHRDIKPANIRVLEDGRVKIMDFGIAKLASAETQLTQKGITMGTASYLPPEQVRGGDLDHRADIFSFGVLAYELMTYQRPFRGNTLSALVYQILYKVPPPVITVWAEAPEALSQLIAKCLEKKPDRRYAHLSELIPELTTVRDAVVAGRYPALIDQPALPGETVGRETEASDVVSQEAIARTARGVLEGKVGEYTISTAVPVDQALSPPEAKKKGSSTRPIEAQTPDKPAPPSPPPGAELKTQVVNLADLPTVNTEPEPGTDVSASFDDLATTAQEISDLVASGKLEAARRQLDATLGRAGLGDAESAPEAEDQRPLVERIDPTLATQAMVTSPAPTEPTPTGPPPVPETTSATEVIEHRAPVATPAPASEKTTPVDAASVPKDPGGSDTYRTVFRPSLSRLHWLGVAAGLVLVAGLAWLLTRGGSEPATEIAEEVAAPEPAAVAPVAAAQGTVLVQAAPWGEITEVTNAEGYLQELPESVHTPVRLTLPPGQYKIHLRAPSGEEIHTCDLDVALNAVVDCAAQFEEVDVTQFFKESGWWE